MAFDISYVYKIVDKYTAPLKKIISTTDKFRKVVKSANLELTIMQGKFYKLRNSAFKPFGGYSSSLSKMGIGIRNVATRFSGLRAAAKRTGNQLLTLRNVMLIGFGTAVLKFPIKEAIEFESKMIDLQRVVDFKPNDSMKSFKQDIFDVGLQFGKLPKDVGETMFQASKMGIAKNDLKEFSKLVNGSSIAFDMKAGVISEMIGSIKTKLGLSIGQTRTLLDSINYGADKLATTGKRTTEIISRTFGVMKSVNMPVKQIAGWAAFSDQIETSARRGSTGFRLMINNMKKIPGLHQHMLKNPTAAIQEYLTRLKEVPKRFREKIITKRFGSEAGQYVRKAVENLKLLKKTLAKTGGSKAVGSMSRELKKYFEGTEYAVDRVKTAFSKLNIQIGEVLTPIVRKIAPIIEKVMLKFGNFLESHPGLVKIAVGIIAITTALAGVALIVGGVMIGFSFLVTPAGLIALAIVGISIALAVAVDWFRNLFKTSKEVREAWKKLSKVFDPLKKSIRNFFKDDDINPTEKTKSWVNWGKVVRFALDAVRIEIKSLTDPLISLLDSLDRLSKNEFLKNLFSGELFSVSTDIKNPPSYNPYGINQESSTDTYQYGASTSVSAEQSSKYQKLMGSIEVKLDKGLKLEKLGFDTLEGDIGLYMNGN